MLSVAQLFDCRTIANEIVRYEDVVDNLRGISRFTYASDDDKARILSTMRGVFEDCIGTMDLNARSIPHSRADYTESFATHSKVVLQSYGFYALHDALDWSIPEALQADCEHGFEHGTCDVCDVEG